MRSFSFLKLFWLTLAIQVVVVLPANFLFAQDLNDYRAQLDLSEVELFGNEGVSLDTNWELYYNQLKQPSEFFSPLKSERVPLTSLWKDLGKSNIGYATYRLQVLLPEKYSMLGLYIPDFYTSYKLYVNDKLVAWNGVVANNEADYVPEFNPQVVFLNDVNGNESIDIVIQVANFKHFRGGINRPIFIGDAHEMSHHMDVSNGLIMLLAGAAFVCGLFFVSLYFFNNVDSSSFYYGIFCLLSAIYITTRGEYLLLDFFPHMPWELVTRLEHFTFFTATFFFLFFVRCLFLKEFNLQIFKISLYVSGFFSLMSIMAPVYIYTMVTPIFLGFQSLMMLYIFYVFAMAIKKDRLGAVFALISVSLLFLAVGYITLYHFCLIPAMPALYFIGLFGSFISMTLLISYRFADSLTQARRRAELASEAKSQFLSNMSHEIRTPLNSVIALSDLLLKSKSEEERKEFLFSIKKSGETLLSIVNDILDYSKIESNELTIRNERVNLRSVIRDIYNINKPICEEKSLYLKLLLDENIPEFILSDATRLQQILNNLIGNAIKFTRKGGIEIKVETNTDNRLKGNLKFCITDTGSGIPDDKLDLLFQRFSQVESKEAKKLSGTGLGLAISKLLSEAMGGQIDVESEWGKGSTFWFTIDALLLTDVKTEDIENPEEVIFHHEFSELKVLLVEDNKMNRLVAVKVLETLGITDIEVAEDGLIAIDMCEKQFYDLIFMDMEMPKLGGVEATKYIRQLVNYGYISKIVAMTANVTLEDERKCLEAGMNDIIFKPISKERILSVLNNLFTDRKNETSPTR